VLSAYSIDKDAKFLRETAVPTASSLSRNLHRDGIEPRVVAFSVTLDECLDLFGGGHG